MVIMLQMCRARISHLQSPRGQRCSGWMNETRLTVVTGMSLVVYRLHGLLQETRDFCGQMCLAHIRLRDETVAVGEVVESLQKLVH